MNDRQRLEQRLGRKVSDRHWDIIEKRYGFDIAATGQLPMTEAVSFAEGMAEESKPTASLRSDEPERAHASSRAVLLDEERVESDGRIKALSVLALLFATDDERVKQWRARYRPDGAERRYDSLTEPEWEHLQDVARYLADRFSWEANDAVRFLALDHEPFVQPVKATLRGSHDGARLPDDYALGGGVWRFPWLQRVELSVDPNLTPAVLAEYWRKLRKRVVVGSHRPPKPRSLRLVTFVADRANEATGVMMKAWNAKHPDERYEQGSHFTRDTQNALNRLFESEPFSWPDE